jgi:GntR family transcriptional regulator/MocR family aminotransferase
VDDQGIQVDRLATLGADAVLVTPAHQFPTGVVLAPQRRGALVEWAQRNDAVIVEDDYDAEYRYDREPIGAVQGLAPDRLVYAGSASKTLAPALRLGWLVLPAWLVEAVAQEKALDDLGSPALEQLALADLLARGEVDRHLRRNRARYRSRRDTLVSALGVHAPQVSIRGIAAGLHAVAELPPQADEATVVAAARRRSVGVYPIGDYRFGGSALPAALVLGYGGLGESAIQQGVRLLAGAISDGCRGPGPAPADRPASGCDWPPDHGSRRAACPRRVLGGKTEVNLPRPASAPGRSDTAFPQVRCGVAGPGFEPG